MPKIRTILAPVDFTEFSNQAADYAVMIARRFGAKVRLVHVIEQFTYSVTDTIQVVDHYGALKAIARPLMETLESRLRRRGVKVDSRVERGNPALRIIELARKGRADLIVMGTHGRTGVQHLLLGSVAERVVRLASCPVLTVRGRPIRRVGPRKVQKGTILI